MLDLQTIVSQFVRPEQENYQLDKPSFHHIHCLDKLDKGIFQAEIFYLKYVDNWSEYLHFFFYTDTATPRIPGSIVPHNSHVFGILAAAFSCIFIPSWFIAFLKFFLTAYFSIISS